ncbi:MAG: dephospho-CoA kinase, partial [Chloroflexi bacterium]|nr:dephospho-CoA kinase [Chloroflexota bacterium]
MATNTIGECVPRTFVRPAESQMTVIGLTGGIASGKSTAAAKLREFGAVVIDADRVGHRVYEPGTRGFEAVVNEFGQDLVQPDGTINRQLLGGKVFGAPVQLKRLTDIVWPEIRRLATEEIADLKRRTPDATVVLEAAVMIEANWIDLADEVWVTTVEPQIARQRIMARNNLTEAQAQARIDSQLSNRERLAHADVHIDNSGTLEAFEQAIEREWQQLMARTGGAAKTGRAAPAKAAATRRSMQPASRAAGAARVATTRSAGATRRTSPAAANGTKTAAGRAKAAGAPKAAAR